VLEEGPVKLLVVGWPLVVEFVDLEYSVAIFVLLYALIIVGEELHDCLEETQAHLVDAGA